jgi:nucleotide-binding universal stress UspA family protein
MKILVAISDTNVPENILDLARKHAQAFKGDICIMVSMKQSPDLEKEDIDKVEKSLEKIKTSFKADGIPCEVIASVCFDSPGEDIVKFASNKNFDEIIIGIKKKSKVGKFVFGSNAQYVILKAPCTVVVAK